LFLLKEFLILAANTYEKKKNVKRVEAEFGFFLEEKNSPLMSFFKVLLTGFLFREKYVILLQVLFDSTFQFLQK